MVAKEKYIGCFIGLAVGDAFGAPYEGGCIERLLWKVIGKTSDGKLRYTDDTQMSIDLTRSFLSKRSINQEHLAMTFADSYKWSRGYGPSASKILKKIKNGRHWYEVNRFKFKEGSHGNGAAMRAPILALCYPHDDELLKKNIVKVSEITHAHPLAIEGAQLIAFVTCSVLNGLSIESTMKGLPEQCSSEVYRKKVTTCVSLLKSSNPVSSRDIKLKLGNGIIATESCVTAIYFGMKYVNESFGEMLNGIFLMGGDADTIGAMAGAIWGAANGGDEILAKIKEVEDSSTIIELAEELYALSI